MPWAFRAAANASTNSAADIAVATGTVIQAGDLLVMTVGHTSGSSGTITYSSGGDGGWTAHTQANSGTALGTKTFYKLATSGDLNTNITFAFGTTAKGGVVMVAFSGIKQTTPQLGEGRQVNASSTNITAPALTHAAATYVEIHVGHIAGDPGITLTGWTTDTAAVYSTGGSPASRDRVRVHWRNNTVANPGAVTATASGAGINTGHHLTYEETPTANEAQAQITWTEFQAPDTIAVLDQPNWRFRSTVLSHDDSATGLNADSGWAAALNVAVNYNAGELGRWRVEVENSGGATTGSKQYRLQYRYQPDGGSYGSWARAADEANFQNEDYLSPIMVKPSAAYVDGAATTNLLAGSGATFVAGTGNEDPLTAALTLAGNEHTELEFSFFIKPHFIDPDTGNRVRLKTNDKIQLRVVESDDTPFNGTYNNAEITVTMPAGYIGSPMIEHPYRLLHQDTNGNLYFLVEFVGTQTVGPHNTLVMLKSTDNGDTWTMPDNANGPGSTSKDVEAVDSQFVSGEGVIVIGVQDGDASRDVWYHEFRTSDNASPDTWRVINQQVTIPSSNPNDQGISLVARSDGTVVLFHRDNDGTNQRVTYKIRTARGTGGTWGSANNLDAEASTNFIFSAAVLDPGNQLTHIFYKPDATGTVYHRSLSSADSLSSRETVATDSRTVIHFVGGARAVHWNDGTNDHVMFGYRRASDSIFMSVVITNDGAPETAKAVSDAAINESSGSTASRQPAADLAQDGNDTWSLFAYSSNGELRSDKATDDGGWTTDVLEIAAPFVAEIGWVRGEIITVGGDFYYGYVYDLDNSATGYQRFVKKLVRSGGAISLTANVTGASTTPDTVSLTVTRSLTANVTGASTTPDTVSLTVTRSLTANVAGASTTPDTVALAVNRSLTANVTGASTTPDTVSLGVTRSLTANVTGASTTPDTASLAVNRSLTANVTGASTTPDTVILSTSIQLTANVTGASTTPDTVALAVNRQLTANVTGASTTPDTVSLAVARSLTANVTGASTTPDTVNLGLLLPFTANVTGASTTPDTVNLGLLISPTANVAGVSTTPDTVSLTVTRSLTANVTGASTTPDTVSLAVNRQLTANVTGASTTPDTVILSTSIQLTASVAGVSSTPDTVSLAVNRSLTASVTGASSTPDTVNLGLAIFPTANVTGASTTPDTTSLAVNRSLTASVAGASTTPDTVSLAVNRSLTANVTGASTTPDTVVLTVQGQWIANVTGASTTPDTVSLAVNRQLTASVTGASTTPDTVVLTVSGIWEANVLGASATPNTVSLGVTRSLTATAAGVSTTPDTVSLGITRSVTASVAGASTTPDTVPLDISRSLVAAVAGATTTPDTVALAVARSLAATAAGASATPDIVSLAVNRQLIASVAGASTTPDTVILTLTVALTANVTGATTTPDVVSLVVARSVTGNVVGVTTTPDAVSLAVLRLFVGAVAGVTTTPDTVVLIVVGPGIFTATGTVRGPVNTMSPYILTDGNGDYILSGAGEVTLSSSADIVFASARQNRAIGPTGTGTVVSDRRS